MVHTLFNPQVWKQCKSGFENFCKNPAPLRIYEDPETSVVFVEEIVIHKQHKKSSSAQFKDFWTKYGSSHFNIKNKTSPHDQVPFFIWVLTGISNIRELA